MMMIPSILDVAALAISAFSPSKTCKVRVSSTRYRNDPYRARVLPRTMCTVAADIKPLPVAVPALKVVAPIVAPTPQPVIAPTAALAAPTTRAESKTAHFALVGFKHETMMFQAPFRVSVGDIVIVEADRGEHIGVVQEITTVVPKYNVPCRILRRASATETGTLDAQRAKETGVTKSIQRLSESLGLGIKIVDTEFQMDNNKLTVFFSSKIFVDFRKLQRSLFRDYRCRIWLVNWAEVRPYAPVAVNRD